MEKSPLRPLKLSFDRISRETVPRKSPGKLILDFLVFTLKILNSAKARELIDIPLLIAGKQIKF